jgi:hypothetical protein
LSTARGPEGRHGRAQGNNRHECDEHAQRRIICCKAPRVVAERPIRIMMRIKMDHVRAPCRGALSPGLPAIVPPGLGLVLVLPVASAGSHQDPRRSECSVGPPGSGCREVGGSSARGSTSPKISSTSPSRPRCPAAPTRRSSKRVLRMQLIAAAHTRFWHMAAMGQCPELRSYRQRWVISLCRRAPYRVASV